MCRSALYALTAILLLLLTEDASAQRSELDSLHRLMRERIPDTVRVNTLNRLSFLNRTRTGIALSSGIQSLTLAKRIGFRRGEAEALLWLSAIQFLRHKNDSARLLAERALELCENILYREGVIWAHIELCRMAIMNGDMEGASSHMGHLHEADKGVDNSELLVWLHITRGELRQRRFAPDEALSSFSEAIRIAESMRDSLSLTDAHKSIAEYYIEENSNATKRHLMIALHIATKLKDSVRIGAAHNNLAKAYFLEHQHDSARMHFELCLDLGERLDERELIESATFNLGVVEARAGRLEAGLQAFIRGANLAREQNNSRLLRQALGNIAQLHAMQKQYDQAIIYLRQSLDLVYAQKDTAAIAETLDDIGMAYFEQGKYDSALSYLHRAVPLAERAGSRNLGWRLSNLGYVQFKSGHLDSAVITFQRSVILGRALEDRALIHNGQAGLARVLASIGRLSEARAAVDEAYVLAREMNNPHAVRNAAASLRMVSEMQGDFRGAYEAHLQYTAMRDSLLHEENLHTISEMSAKYEAEQRERQIALLEKDREIKDLALARQGEELRVRTLEALKRKQQIGLLEKDSKIQSLEIARREADYDRQRAVTERREHEVRLLTKDGQLQASQLARETSQRNAMLLGLGALLVLTVLVFYRYREKKKANTHLSITLSELQRTQNQLIHAEKMATLGELTAGIAHEIKNPLNFVTNFSTVSREMVEELEEQVHTLTNNAATEAPEVLSLLGDLKENMGKIQGHGRRADDIVKSMLLHARSQKGVRQETDVNTLLREALQLALHGMRTQKQDFTVDIEEQYSKVIPSIEVIPQEMSRVFLNVLSNAFEAVSRRSEQTENPVYVPVVRVHTIVKTEQVEIRIWDNGSGIPKSMHEKIFQPFFTTKVTGEGTGLGLSLSYNIVVKGHGGTIRVESDPGTYTEFIVTLSKDV